MNSLWTAPCHWCGVSGYGACRCARCCAVRRAMARSPGPAPGAGRRGRRGRYAVAQPGERLHAIRQRPAADRREPAGRRRHASPRPRSRARSRTATRCSSPRSAPNAVSHALAAKLPYDPHTAFTPIIHAANLPAVVLIRPTLPYKTLAEFIAAAKQQPGKFNYASAGVGNWTHLFMAYLNSLAGIDQVNVVYRSGAEMLTRCCATKPTPRSSRSRLRSARSGTAGFARSPASRAADAAAAGHAAGGANGPRVRRRRLARHRRAGRHGRGARDAHQRHLQSGAATAGGAQSHHRVAGRRDHWRHAGSSSMPSSKAS